MLAFLLVLLAANNHMLPHHLNVGTIVTFATLPVWIGSLHRYRSAVALLAMFGVAIASGLLTATSRLALHGFDSDMAETRLFELTALLGIFGVTVWARTQLPTPMVALAFGLGMLSSIKLHGNSAVTATSADAWNIWKFELALPLAVIGLSVAWLVRSRTLEITIPLLLAVGSSLNDARSSFAMLVFTAGIAVFMTGSTKRRDHTHHRRRPWLVGTALLAAGAAIAYKLVETFILSGGLGEEARERTLAQVQASGSLLLGGRPEAFATLALARELPLGFGLGIPARLSDITVAKTGMSKLGYDPNNGYVERYMFGGQIELHSFIGDVWAAFGLGGLALVAYLVFLIVRVTARQIRARTAPALVIHLALQSLWAVFFSPVSSALVIMLMVAITFDPLGRPQPTTVVPPVAAPD